MNIIETRNERTKTTLYKLEGASRLEVARFKAEHCKPWACVLEVAENITTLIFNYDEQPPLPKPARPRPTRYGARWSSYNDYMAEVRRFEPEAFYDHERGLY